MRMTILAFAAVAAFGVTMSAVAPVAAQDRIIVRSGGDRHDGVRVNSNRSKVVVVNRRDNGLHKGWYKKRGNDRHVVVVKRKRDHNRGSVVIHRN